MKYLFLLFLLWGCGAGTGLPNYFGGWTYWKPEYQISADGKTITYSTTIIRFPDKSQGPSVSITGPIDKSDSLYNCLKSKADSIVNLYKKYDK